MVVLHTNTPRGRFQRASYFKLILSRPGRSPGAIPHWRLESVNVTEFLARYKLFTTGRDSQRCPVGGNRFHSADKQVVHRGDSIRLLRDECREWTVIEQEFWPIGMNVSGWSREMLIRACHNSVSLPGICNQSIVERVPERENTRKHASQTFGVSHFGIERQKMRIGVKRSALLLCLAMSTMLTSAVQAADVRQGVPADVYLVIYGKDNPEREYQKQYYREVWETVEQTRIIERFVEIITAQMDADDVEQAQAVIDEIKEAAAPIDFEALSGAKEVVYAQSMAGMSKFPTSQHLVLIKSTEKASADAVEGIENLFRMAEKYAGGPIAVQKTATGGVTRVSLRITPPGNAPFDFPFQPTAAALGDVLVITSNAALADQSIAQMSSGGGPSKFDDQRLKDALAKLPEAEDAIIFYDGRTQFQQLSGLTEFIRNVSGGDPEAARIADVIEAVLDEMSVLDFEVTVEYTEGYQNRTASYGRLIPGTSDKVLAKALASNKPFENWSSWVPSNATSYSLTTGINLHEIYAWAIPFIREQFPESNDALDAFEVAQTQFGVHLDKDLLQSFSGECVTVSMPSAVPNPFGAGGEGVLFVRCQNPDRIGELLNRLYSTLQDIPQLKAQGLQITDAPTLDGFKKISATPLQFIQANPVIGLRDGWFVIGSSANAVQAVLDTRSGDAPNISTSESFQRFGLDIEGDVHGVSYTDLAASTKATAQMLNTMGTMLPTLMAMGSGGQADIRDMKPVMDALGLLPSLGRIVAKMDFLQARLSVTQEGEEPGSYRKRSVTLVRPPR